MEEFFQKAKSLVHHSSDFSTAEAYFSKLRKSVNAIELCFQIFQIIPLNGTVNDAIVSILTAETELILASQTLSYVVLINPLTSAQFAKLLQIASIYFHLYVIHTRLKPIYLQLQSCVVGAILYDMTRKCNESLSQLNYVNSEMSMYDSQSPIYELVCLHQYLPLVESMFQSLVALPCLHSHFGSSAAVSIAVFWMDVLRDFPAVMASSAFMKRLKHVDTSVLKSQPHVVCSTGGGSGNYSHSNSNSNKWQLLSRVFIVCCLDVNMGYIIHQCNGLLAEKSATLAQSAALVGVGVGVGLASNGYVLNALLTTESVSILQLLDTAVQWMQLYVASTSGSTAVAADASSVSSSHARCCRNRLQFYNTLVSQSVISRSNSNSSATATVNFVNAFDFISSGHSGDQPAAADVDVTHPCLLAVVLHYLRAGAGYRSLREVSRALSTTHDHCVSVYDCCQDFLLLLGGLATDNGGSGSQSHHCWGVGLDAWRDERVQLMDALSRDLLPFLSALLDQQFSATHMHSHSDASGSAWAQGSLAECAPPLLQRDESIALYVLETVCQTAAAWLLPSSSRPPPSEVSVGSELYTAMRRMVNSSQQQTTTMIMQRWSLLLKNILWSLRTYLDHLSSSVCSSTTDVVDATKGVVDLASAAFDAVAPLVVSSAQTARLLWPTAAASASIVVTVSESVTLPPAAAADQVEMSVALFLQNCVFELCQLVVEHSRQPFLAYSFTRTYTATATSASVDRDCRSHGNAVDEEDEEAVEVLEAFGVYRNELRDYVRDILHTQSQPLPLSPDSRTSSSHNGAYLVNWILNQTIAVVQRYMGEQQRGIASAAQRVSLATGASSGSSSSWLWTESWMHLCSAASRALLAHLQSLESRRQQTMTPQQSQHESNDECFEYTQRLAQLFHLLSDPYLVQGGADARPLARMSAVLLGDLYPSYYSILAHSHSREQLQALNTRVVVFVLASIRHSEVIGTGVVVGGGDSADCTGTGTGNDIAAVVRLCFRYLPFCIKQDHCGVVALGKLRTVAGAVLSQQWQQQQVSEGGHVATSAALLLHRDLARRCSQHTSTPVSAGDTDPRHRRCHWSVAESSGSLQGFMLEALWSALIDTPLMVESAAQSPVSASGTHISFRSFRILHESCHQIIAQHMRLVASHSGSGGSARCCGQAIIDGACAWCQVGGSVIAPYIYAALICLSLGAVTAAAAVTESPHSQGQMMTQQEFKSASADALGVLQSVDDYAKSTASSRCIAIASTCSGASAASSGVSESPLPLYVSLKLGVQVVTHTARGLCSDVYGFNRAIASLVSEEGFVGLSALTPAIAQYQLSQSQQEGEAAGRRQQSMEDIALTFQRCLELLTQAHTSLLSHSSGDSSGGVSSSLCLTNVGLIYSASCCLLDELIVPFVQMFMSVCHQLKLKLRLHEPSLHASSPLLALFSSRTVVASLVQMLVAVVKTVFCTQQIFDSLVNNQLLMVESSSSSDGHDEESAASRQLLQLTILIEMRVRSERLAQLTLGLVDLFLPVCPLVTLAGACVIQCTQSWLALHTTAAASAAAKTDHTVYYHNFRNESIEMMNAFFASISSVVASVVDFSAVGGGGVPDFALKATNHHTATVTAAAATATATTQMKKMSEITLAFNSLLAFWTRSFAAAAAAAVEGSAAGSAGNNDNDKLNVPSDVLSAEEELCHSRGVVAIMSEVEAESGACSSNIHHQFHYFKLINVLKVFDLICEFILSYGKLLLLTNHGHINGGSSSSHLGKWRSRHTNEESDADDMFNGENTHDHWQVKWSETLSLLTMTVAYLSLSRSNSNSNNNSNDISNDSVSPTWVFQKDLFRVDRVSKCFVFGLCAYIPSAFRDEVIRLGFSLFSCLGPQLAAESLQRVILSKCRLNYSCLSSSSDDCLEEETKLAEYIFSLTVSSQKTRIELPKQLAIFSSMNNSVKGFKNCLKIFARKQQ